MTQDEVVALMRSSQSEKEWNENCHKVMAAFDGYPGFWYSAIILGGVHSETLSNIHRLELGICDPSELRKKV